MRRLLHILICIALISGMLVLNGCKNATGSDVCRLFLDYLHSGNYEAAYELLSAKSRNDTEKPVAQRISKTEFCEKHRAIFGELGITDFTVSNVTVTQGEIITVMKYDVTYHSEETGDMKDSFSMVAVRESGQWRIEWSPALIFSDMQWGDTVRVATLNSKRGEILTQDGSLLAATVEPVTVTVTPSKLQDVNMSIIKIADLLEMPTSEVQKKVDSAYNDLALIKQFYPEELLGFIKEQLLLIPGVSISRGSSFGTLRQYPNSSLMAHALGYLGLANEADLEYIKSNWPDTAYKYNTDSLVGKLGLERMYEDKLCGTDGKMIYISTAEQYNRRALYTEPAQDGLDLILTIDYDLQQRVEELLSLVLYGDNTSGAVIVMDPNTGAVKAMASYPSYDLNAFLGGISEEGYNALLNQKNKPLFNRATQGLYPPGSSFKPFTAALVLDKGLIDPDWVFDGKIVDDYWTPENYGTWVGQPIKRAAMNNRTEPLNMFNAVLNSDNIYFANAALKAGADEFSNYAQRIGLGEAIPFDIAVAKSQLLNEGTRMTLEMLADSGYGQGEMLITPLQMAATFSAFANGGNIPVPYLIESMNRQEATDYSAVYTAEPAVWKSGVVTKAAIARIEPMLKGVVDPELNGTGSRLKVTSCTVAGKTGTAQVGNDKSREISWFIGYRTGVPQEAARLVLVALEVPATSEYSTLKFDIARQLLKMSAE